MIKQFVIIITAVCIALALVACNDTVENTDSISTIYDKQMSFSIDKASYQLAFESYLNSSHDNLEIPQEYQKLISESLLAEINHSSEDTSTLGEPEVGLSEGPSYEEETDEYAQEEDEYPIVDNYGNIISYGTKEESDQSYEEYNNTPYYKVNSCSIFYDRILFKVYNKGEMKTVAYLATLNDYEQISSYEILTIMG